MVNTINELSSIVELASDRNKKKIIEKAYDAMRSGQVVSSSSVAELEETIICSIAEVREVVAEDEGKLIIAVNSLLAQIAERDKALELLA